MMHHSPELISYCCVTRISWLPKWKVIVACHCWYTKLRHIRDMAETLLVARDGNGNHNSSPTFLFSVCGHPRIPRVSENMDASCKRKSSNNGERTRKQTWPICSSSAWGKNVVHSCTLCRGNPGYRFRHFLIMRHISNVGSCCLNFCSCVTWHKLLFLERRTIRVTTVCPMF